MKEYRIRVLVNSGSTSYFAIDTTIKGELVDMGNGYYRFENSDGKDSYYPIISTIVEEK